MSLASLTSAQLHRLIELVKEKEMIEAKLAQVAHSLDDLQGAMTKGAMTTNATKAKPVGKKNGLRRGRRRAALKDALLGKLQAAGKAGLSVQELAASLRAEPARVSVWFYTTGKKIKGIQKIGTARYAYTVTK